MGKTNKERMVRGFAETSNRTKVEGVVFWPWKAGGLLIISLSGFSIGSSGGQIWLRMMQGVEIFSGYVPFKSYCPSFWGSQGYFQYTQKVLAAKGFLIFLLASMLYVSGLLLQNFRPISRILNLNSVICLQQKQCLSLSRMLSHSIKKGWYTGGGTGHYQGV